MTKDISIWKDKYFEMMKERDELSQILKIK